MDQSRKTEPNDLSSLSHPARNLPLVGVVDIGTHTGRTGNGDNVSAGSGDWLPGEVEEVTLDDLICQVDKLRATVAALTAILLEPDDQFRERFDLSGERLDLAG